MKSTKSYTIHPKHLSNAKALRRTQAAEAAVSAPPADPPKPASTVRTTPRNFANPVDYQHPYESMGRFAQALALRYDANRTRHFYYRQLRLLHEHFALDPSLLTETHLRDYFLFVKLQKDWKPKSIRLALAAIQQFFVGLLGHTDWKIFRQIRTKDHDVLPPVLTRREVHTLLAHIRLRRYRTPIKLIYACGLRLSECLALTIHDNKGAENKLLIRSSKGHRDRVLPLPNCLYPVTKLVEAPYFLLTFTLPAQLRPCFLMPFAKQAYDLFFAAVSGSRPRNRGSRGMVRPQFAGHQ